MREKQRLLGGYGTQTTMDFLYDHSYDVALPAQPSKFFFPKAQIRGALDPRNTYTRNERQHHAIPMQDFEVSSLGLTLYRTVARQLLNGKVV